MYKEKLTTLTFTFHVPLCSCNLMEYNVCVRERNEEKRAYGETRRESRNDINFMFYTESKTFNVTWLLLHINTIAASEKQYFIVLPYRSTACEWVLCSPLTKYEIIQLIWKFHTPAITNIHTYIRLRTISTYVKWQCVN